MKFIIYRTSNMVPTKEAKPCEEATLDREVNRMATWTVEIESIEALCAFCNKYGDVIIHPKEEDEEIPSLEIYDSYRE